MTSYDDDNIFAKIVRNEIPNDTVYEDEYVLAFKDIAPQAPVHVLVIPKGAYIDIYDFGANGSIEEITAFTKAITVIIDKLKLKYNGFRVIANSGQNGGQEVPHYHVHILGGQHMGPMVSKSS